jgi:type I restriction enzyme S subunit
MKISWNYLGVAVKEREKVIETLGEGSTGQTELSRARLGALPVLVPPKPLRDHFDTAVLNLRLRTRCNDLQNVVLAEVRDALLPKLLSGELRVPVNGAV